MRREITPLDDVCVESVKLLAGKKPTQAKKEGSKVKHLHPKFLTQMLTPKP